MSDEFAWLNGYWKNVFMELGVFGVANNKQRNFLKWFSQKINAYIHCYSHWWALMHMNGIYVYTMI